MSFTSSFIATSNVKLAKQDRAAARAAASSDAELAKQDREAIRTAAVRQNNRVKAELFTKGFQQSTGGDVSVVPGGTADLKQQQQEQDMKIMRHKIATTERLLALQDSDSALQEFITTGDASIFQHALNKNTQLSEIWAKRGLKGVSNIDWQNDKGILGQAGFGAEQFDTPDKQAQLGKAYFKVFDGQKHSIASAETFMKQTGILQRSTTAKQQVLIDHFAKSAASQHVNAFEAKAQFIAEAKGIPLNEAIDLIRQGSKGDRGVTAWETKMLLEAKALGVPVNEHIASMARKRDEDRGTARSRDLTSEAGKLGVSEGELLARREDRRDQALQPSAVRKEPAIEEARQQLLAAFGDEAAFYKTDFSKAENFNKVSPKLEKFERLAGVELSQADVKDLKSLNELISLGDLGKEISPKETGLIDSFLHNTLQFVSDSVGGVKAAAAHTAFRNTVRRAMSGTALTATEVEANAQAFGTLGQQLGPVREKFAVALEQVKSTLDTIARVNNPAVIKVRVGVSQDKLARILQTLDGQIAGLRSPETSSAEPTKVDFTKFKF